jgi:hypothetical protein
MFVTPDRPLISFRLPVLVVHVRKYVPRLALPLVMHPPASSPPEPGFSALAGAAPSTVATSATHVQTNAFITMSSATSFEMKLDNVESHDVRPLLSSLWMRARRLSEGQAARQM